jgi:membrane protein implicated in regulation of membrane protease activity
MMKWALLIFAPFLVGAFTMLAFLYWYTTIIWLAFLVLAVAIWVSHYEKHHRGEALDKWELSEKQWSQRVANYIAEVKARDEKNS